MSAPATGVRVSFGLFEVDLQSEEIWKAGFRVKLQNQPFKVLASLLERPGQVVTRDELQMRLWGKDTIVDFDHSLGTAVNKIREALGDSAENPRFIETLSKRGYRFIAPVTVLEVPAAQGLSGLVAGGTAVAAPLAAETTTASGGSTAVQAAAAATAVVDGSAAAGSDAGRKRRLRGWLVVGVLVASACVAGFLVGSARTRVLPPHVIQITHSGHLAASVLNTERLAEAATDGAHLFVEMMEGGRSGLAALSLIDGSVSPIVVPDDVAGPALGDISPDGARLLLRDHLSPESEQPLWVVPTQGGSALRVGDVLAHDATWMPDGKGILYGSGNELYLTSGAGGRGKLYATLPGRAFWMRWSPNGKVLRFTVIDPIAHTTALWQLGAGDRRPVRLLEGFGQPAAECCGVWTADGRAFVFEAKRGGASDLWELRGTATVDPVQLTDGPLEFESPVAARTGGRVYFLGVDTRSEMDRVSDRGELAPVDGFLKSAVRVDSTRDGRWVAWTDAQGELWRARTDGGEKLQLTPETLDVFLAHWSPDGTRLAVMAREPGKAWQIYVVSADGGDVQPLLREGRNAADPSWSPDGQRLVYGRVNDLLGKESGERTLHVLDLATHGVEEVPGSDGMFSPRWSPDGRYIAALTLDQRHVRLYDAMAKTWRELPVTSGADPVWSRDGRYLYVHASQDPGQPIERISIADNKVTEVVRLASSRQNDAVDYVFGGLGADNEPLVRSRVYTGNVYSLDLR